MTSNPGRGSGPLLFAMASGAVQSLVTMTAHQIGNRLPERAVLPVMLVVGAAWGACQVVVVAGCIGMMPSGPSPGLSFSELRAALARAAAPFFMALWAWLGGILLVGRTLYLDPEFAIIATPLSGWVAGAVAVATVVACAWSAVLVVTRSGGRRAGVIAVALLGLTTIGYYGLAPVLFSATVTGVRP